MLVDPNNPFGDLVPTSAAPGVIYGPPKTKEPKAPVFVPPNATQIFDPNTGTYAPVPQTGDDKDAIKTAIEGLGVDELLASLKKAHDNLKSGWATGTWGAIAELKPGGGTPRDDFLGHLTSIQGGIINEKLAALKELSKTGASGLGALSEKEGERLASSVAALTPDMSQQAYEDSFKEIARHAETLRAVRDGKDPRDPATKKAIEGAVSAMFPTEAAPAAPAAPGETGGDKLGIGKLTPEQSTAYSAFIAAHDGKPPPDALKVFLEKLTGNTVTNAEGIAADLAKGRGFSTTTEDLSYKAKVRQELERQNKLGLGESAAETLTKSGATLNLSDEASGVGRGLSFALQGKNPIAGYQLGRDAERLRIADARSQLGGWGTGLEVAGGLMSANPEAVLARAPNVLATVKQGARAGAYGGALAGFGSGEGLENSTQRAVMGGAAGAVLGGSLSGLSARYAPRGMNPELAQASQAEGVDLLKPMVDPSKISDYGALESNVYSQPIIRGAASRVRGQIEDRVLDLGKGGTALETGAAGDITQTAGNRFITRSRDIKNRLYDRAEKLGGTTSVTTSEAQGQIDNELAQLNEAPTTNAGEISYLEGLKSDLAQPQTVGSIRRIRTALRGQINAANLTNTTAETRALRVLDAAKNDIQRDAPADAASAYTRADAFNRERQTHIDTVLKQFLGKRDMPLDSEKAFARLKTLASPGGGGRKLAAMMRNLEPDERQDIAATIANSLGRDAADAPFSTAKFLSQTNKFSPSARKTIFGPDGAQSIDNLRLLSRKLEVAEKDINRSRSATVLERQGWRLAARNFISTVAGIGGGGALAAGHTATGVAGIAVAGGAMAGSAVRKVLSARAMVNPRVSRWLAESADVSTPTQAEAAVRRLGTIISREPALAGELTPIQKMLENALRPAVASDEVQPQQNADQ